MYRIRLYFHVAIKSNAYFELVFTKKKLSTCVILYKNRIRNNVIVRFFKVLKFTFLRPQCFNISFLRLF